MDSEYQIDELANARARLTVHRDLLNQLRFQLQCQEREVEQLERDLLMRLSPFQVGDCVITKSKEILFVASISLSPFQSKYTPTNLIYCLTDGKGNIIYSEYPLEFIKKYEG